MVESSQSRAGHVAIVGRPNVGKSTLLNRLVGQRLSITSRKPQTTRHRIVGIVTSPQAQCAFVDTPGFQSGRTNALGAAMNRTVTRALAEVDAVVFVLEAGRFTPEDEQVAALLPKRVPVIVAVNKVDRLVDRSALLPFLADLERRLAPRAIVPVSARQGYQVSVLLREIEAALPIQPPLYSEDQLTDRDERFFAAEFLREKLFRLLGDELPYASAVVIDKFEHRPKLRRIHATIFVDKPSHKAIVIGENGERMKAIASSARKDLEALFDGKVFLQVWVKVRRGWTDDASQLQRFGYE
ncbi:MAG: GTPase Era [Betaproteobacteria bacterium]|nr:MAG: GTPase Era [Betaproteobacteria bacterium]